MFKKYIVGNRAFSSRASAEDYCKQCDFDPEMIQEEIDEETTATYIANCRNDKKVAADILKYLKSIKVNVVTPRVIKTGKYCKDIWHMLSILREGGFNVEVRGATLWLLDTTCSYMHESYRGNKLEIIFEA